MAYGAEQLEDINSCIFNNSNKPWMRRSRSGSRTFNKKARNRRERQRVRLNVECQPEHKRYFGWEY